MPAFKTKTGIPYGTVNLRHGVPKGETEVASTAGAGSLFVEFGVLSFLTGERHYGDLAFTAVKALYTRQSPAGLVGKHIHISSGRWVETLSGIGSNSDSYYEYLLKGYLLFHGPDTLRMFSSNFVAIKRYYQAGDWFNDVDMYFPKQRKHRVENLAAFWPGVESTLGYSESAARELNAFFAIWQSLGFLPEEIDETQWLRDYEFGQTTYPLRPELIESVYHHYQATHDKTWLHAGKVIFDSLENRTKTLCGYASISQFTPSKKGVDKSELIDSMPSFFLSETVKYLYLLFDDSNFLHLRPYVFSTEAHPFDIRQLHIIGTKIQNESNFTS